MLKCTYRKFTLLGDRSDSVLGDRFKRHMQQFLMDDGFSIETITMDNIDSVYSYNNWDDAIEEFIGLFLELSGVEKVYNYLDFSKIQRDLEIDGYRELNAKVYYNFN